jgi:plastocyanin
VRPRHGARSALGIVPILVAICGCGGSGSVATHVTPQQTAASGVAATERVKIVNFAYAPTPIRVRLGATVTWSNSDATEHTATADVGSAFDTGTLTHGASKAVTFSRPGTFTYHCVFHAFMHGTVTVVR